MSDRKIVRSRPVRHVLRRGARGIGSGSGLPAGGSTAQALVKNSNTDYDVTWATVSGVGGGSIATDLLWDAAGDLAVGTGANAAARLALGGQADILMVSGSTIAWKSNPSYTVTSTDALLTLQSSALAGYAAGLIATESGLRASADSTLTTNLTTVSGFRTATSNALTTTITNLALTSGYIDAGTSLNGLPGPGATLDSDDGVLAYEDGTPVIATPLYLSTVVSTAGAVMKSLFDANTMLVATADDTPVANNSSSVRTFLGVQPGTDVQAYDSDLAAIALLTTVSYGRSLLTLGSNTALTSESRAGMIAIVSGKTVSATSATTSLISGTLSVPPAITGDTYRLRATGSFINLTGSSLTCTLSGSYAGTSMWTPYAVTLPTFSACSYLIDAYIRVPVALTSSFEYVTTTVTVSSTGSGANGQIPVPDWARYVDATLSAVNNTSSRSVVLQVTHNSTSASLTTIGKEITVQRIPQTY